MKLRTLLITAGLVAAGVVPSVTTANTGIQLIPCNQSCFPGDIHDLQGVRVIRRSIDQFSGRLPNNLSIDVMIVDGLDFAHRRPEQAEGRHLIAIGADFMIQMYNSWTDEFGWYDGDDQAAADAASREASAAYEAFLEWSFYHEVGHALLDHSERYVVKSDKSLGPFHEKFADSFATITMLRSGRNQGYDVALAASGILVLTLPDGSEVLSGLRWRNLDRKEPGLARKGKRWSKLLGDVHSPNPQRAWDILCLMYGAGLVDSPGEYQGHHDGSPAPFVCEQDDYSGWANYINSVRNK